MIKLLALYKEGSYTDYHGSFCLIFTQVRHILDRAARSFLFFVSPLNASLTELETNARFQYVGQITNTNPSATVDVSSVHGGLLASYVVSGSIVATALCSKDGAFGTILTYITTSMGRMYTSIQISNNTASASFPTGSDVNQRVMFHCIGA